MLKKLLKKLEESLLKRDFVRVSVNGTTAIMTPAEACDMVKDSGDPKQYEVSPVRMTMRQFKAMPEFAGY